MKILKLTLKKKWFDMILTESADPKRDEYREFKDYWVSRLVNKKYLHNVLYYVKTKGIPTDFFNHFDAVQFTNGYSATSPTFTIECKGIKIGVGKKEWGAPNELVFIINLGEIIK